MSTKELFMELVGACWEGLHIVGRQYVSDEHLDDLIQETLYRAWRNFSTAEGRTFSRGWLFAIMRNVAQEWSRQAASKIRVVMVADAELTELIPASLGDPLGRLPAMSEEKFRELLDERIAKAFGTLDAQFREVILLSVEAGLSYREIASVLQCPVGTVMSRMARARRALRERLAGFVGSKRFIEADRS